MFTFPRVVASPGASGAGVGQSLNAPSIATPDGMAPTYERSRSAGIVETETVAFDVVTSASLLMVRPRVPFTFDVTWVETRNVVPAPGMEYGDARAKVNPSCVGVAVAIDAWVESRRTAPCRSAGGRVPVAVTRRDVTSAIPRSGLRRSSSSSVVPVKLAGARLTCSMTSVAWYGLTENPLVSSVPSKKAVSNEARRDRTPGFGSGIENSRRFASAPRPIAASTPSVADHAVKSSRSAVAGNVYAAAPRIALRAPVISTSTSAPMLPAA